MAKNPRLNAPKSGVSGRAPKAELPASAAPAQVMPPGTSPKTPRNAKAARERALKDVNFKGTQPMGKGPGEEGQLRAFSAASKGKAPGVSPMPSMPRRAAQAGRFVPQDSGPANVPAPYAAMQTPISAMPLPFIPGPESVAALLIDQSMMNRNEEELDPRYLALLKSLKS